MNLKFAYNDDSEILFRQVRDSIAEKYPLIIVEGFHENLMKERKKAFAIKNEWGSRLAPFAILIDNDNVPVIAFYSEKGSCTSEKINEALHNWIVYGKKIC